MLTLKLHRDALEFIASVGGKQAGQISLKIFALLKNPNPHDSLALRGVAGELRRADVGEYRIIYRVLGDLLDVPIVGLRNDDEVYKQLKRKGY